VQILNVGCIVTVTDESMIEVDIESNLKFLEPYGMSGRIEVESWRYEYDKDTKRHVKVPYISRPLKANKLWTGYDKKFVPAQIMLYPGMKFEVTRLRNAGGIAKRLTQVAMRVVETGDKNPKKTKKSVLLININEAKQIVADITDPNDQ
jgi:hypothetical protein